MAAGPYAYLGGRLATELAEISSDPADLERGGFWAVVATFEGGLTFARFDDVRPAPLPPGHWRGPAATSWSSSLDQAAYEDGVRRIRDHIAAGDVYQVNLCRVLSTELDLDRADPAGLAALLARGNPAPYAAIVDLGDHWVVSASPELFLRRRGRDMWSAPIKGTAPTAAELLPKDWDENVMIVDLVRNDLGRVCEPGSVEVEALCALEPHPGLVHLVSTVRGHLTSSAGWPELLAATMPPGSVSGAPKSSALEIIRALEPVPRGPYCGAVGWVDADAGTAELAVGIRTFWVDASAGPPRLRFGTGAGITWGSDPAGEWEETALKARTLLGLAALTLD